MIHRLLVLEQQLQQVKRKALRNGEKVIWWSGIQNRAKNFKAALKQQVALDLENPANDMWEKVGLTALCLWGGGVKTDKSWVNPTHPRRLGGG